MVDDAVEYTYNWATAVNDLSLAMRNLESGTLAALSSSKEWTVVSRLVSGSAFWRIQNKFRAITDMAVVYDKAMRKAAERTNEAVEAYSKYYDIHTQTPKFGQGPHANQRQILGQSAAMHGTDPTQFNEMFAKSPIGKIFASKEFQSVKMIKNEEAALDMAAEQVEASQKMLKAYKQRIKDIEEYGKASMWKKMVIQSTRFWRVVSMMIKMAMTMFIPAALKWMGILVLIVPPIILVVSMITKFIIEAGGYLKGLYDTIWEATGGGQGFWSSVKEWIAGILSNYAGLMQAALSGSVTEFGAALWKLFTESHLGAAKMFLKLGRSLITMLLTAGLAVMNPLMGILGWFKRKIGGGIGSIRDKINSHRDKIKITRLAATGGVRGGRTLVGELGPELVDLPYGSRVHANNKSRAMGGNTIHVHVNGRVGASDAEIRDIAQKVSREINIQMNRTSTSRGAF